MKHIPTSICLIFLATLLTTQLDLSGVDVLPLVRAQCIGGCGDPIPPAPSPTPTPLPAGTLDLKAYGIIGNGVADNGPAFQRAIDALTAAGGGTLLVPPGRYAIRTPVRKDFRGKAFCVTIRGTGAPAELIIKVGEQDDALTLQSLEDLVIENLIFIGDQEADTDARITLALKDIEHARIRNCQFYGLASHVDGAIVYADHSSLEVTDSYFWGCSTSSGLGTSVIDNVSWKGITITNTTFLDYGLRPDFYSKTPLAPPYSWVNIGNAAAVDGNGSPREVVIRDVFMDEGAFIGITCLEAALGAPIKLIFISGLDMNVTNLAGGGGVSLQNAEQVFIERAHFGWSDWAHPAINLGNVGSAILDVIECEKEANIIGADATTQKLVVVNSIYKTLDSSAQRTQAISTAPTDDPVVFVRQQFLKVLGLEPDPEGLVYWSDLILQCGHNSVCRNKRGQVLTKYLSQNGVVQDIAWVDMVDTTVTGNSLEKITGCEGCWAGAISQQGIAAGDGYVEFTVTQTDKMAWIGLTHSNTNAKGLDTEYAIAFNGAGWAEVRESGSWMKDTRFTARDVFRIAVEGGVVKYYKNGQVFYESKKKPLYPLRLNAAIYGLHGIINNTRIAVPQKNLTRSENTSLPST